jgi:hypothetical protein
MYISVIREKGKVKMFKVSLDVFQSNEEYFILIDKRIVIEVFHGPTGDYVDYLCTLPKGVRFKDWICKRIDYKMIDIEGLILEGGKTGFSIDDIMDFIKKKGD